MRPERNMWCCISFVALACPFAQPSMYDQNLNPRAAIILIQCYTLDEDIMICLVNWNKCRKWQKLTWIYPDAWNLPNSWLQPQTQRWRRGPTPCLYHSMSKYLAVILSNRLPAFPRFKFDLTFICHLHICPPACWLPSLSAFSRRGLCGWEPCIPRQEERGVECEREKPHESLQAGTILADIF